MIDFIQGFLLSKEVMMTWGELKKIIAKYGINDSTEICIRSSDEEDGFAYVQAVLIVAKSDINVVVLTEK